MGLYESFINYSENNSKELPNIFVLSAKVVKA